MLRIPPPICEALSVTSPQPRVHDWYAAISLTACQFDHSLCRLQPRFGGSTHIRWLADATLILIYVCPRQICTASAVNRDALYVNVYVLSVKAPIWSLAWDHHQRRRKNALHALRTGAGYVRMQNVLTKNVHPCESCANLWAMLMDQRMQHGSN